MNRSIPRLLARFLLVLVLGTFPSVARAGVTIRIGTPPPALREEVVTVAPSPRHVWIAGHWQWNGHRHVWSPGRWVRGRAGHDWVAARWVEERGKWVYVPGAWHRR